MKERRDAQDDWLDADRIISYHAMKGSIKQHICARFPHINVLQYDDNIVLYNLDGKDKTTRGVNVQMTMRIFPDMTVRVFIRDEQLPSNELNWALSQTNGILLYCSQLDNILTRYGVDTDEISGALSNQMMPAASIQQLYLVYCIHVLLDMLQGRV